MAEVLKTYEPEIESVKVIPSDGGRFEVSVNGEMVYSKLQTHRHAEPGEVAGSIREILRRS
jgi:selenoprotein W-related protein